MAKALIIVESPAKARTLKKYLGREYEVKASVGHVRDLPVSKLGVDIENDFAPQYVTIKGKSKIINDLKKAAKDVDEIFLAPDPDREGEAIAWHIAESLKAARKPIHRALFHELTKKAIVAAIENATEINQPRFEAQQARRILDRLVGYQISPLLWEKVRRGLSAGRVQSVAVRMVCEREAEVEAFVSEEYWSVAVQLEGQSPPAFTAQIDTADGEKVKIGTEKDASAATAVLRKAKPVVRSVEKKKKNRRPQPPFITSTMQQDANRKLHFSAKKTMTLAQRLYEGLELGDRGPTGLITYMRTDSTRINDEALSEVREYINRSWGKEFLPPKPNIYKSAKAAQEAHEAIRPTDVSLSPETVAPFLEKDLLNLYTLIWKRFVASQMRPAVYDQTSILIDADRYGLKATGSIIRFPGFMTLYVAATDDAAQADSDVTLPDIAAGDVLKVLGVDPKQHFTQPPPRYNEATLVKALEENGVGRPSTYAAIISTIVDKEYVLLQQRRFYPTDLGRLVNDLLVAHFPAIMNVEFTASMEADLDRVEEGKVNWRELLRDFYGPFHDSLAEARKEMKSIKLQVVPTDISCPQPDCDGMLVIKWGRMGEFLACEKYPACKHTQNFTKDSEGKIRAVEREQPEVSEDLCEKCGKQMVYRSGRFGRFLACSGYPACKHVRAQTTGVSCPEASCTGELVQKVSKRGKPFYSCSRFPKCRYALWDKPVDRPCPKCKATFRVEKESKKSGRQLVCVDQNCKFSEPFDDEGDKD